MTLGARAKLALILGGFALPIAASLAVYTFGRPRPTANYGELLLPPDSITGAAFTTAGGEPFRFRSLEGRWILLAADRGACDPACRSKLVAIRQVHLALGREAERVATVTVVADGVPPAPSLAADFPAMVFALPADPPAARAAVTDASHIYLVDPHGNVMMRWPARPEYKRMKDDLDRLLRASQIG
ncbi:MAG TPA: hypothetical protein VFE23_15915 [Usitatibacter sp.]|jgi:hypothetical protein|nr:hypothetical protein [Usitatibacter sp.]